ncbi:S4 domain-containing protein YaaA [Longirhabdus pacifica]|uniref:S4 domain-containing protein YaaA n=1 Tax=Longirhabdus pacifica TaxID=2305227 RepID=UPI001008F4D1|nr:S4 domain-containing protein YaaA [Longirhabdus pacifica]
MKAINIQDEFVTLGQILKMVDLISTGGQAKMFLQDVVVRVNGEHDQRRGRKCYIGDKVEIEGHDTYTISKN